MYVYICVCVCVFVCYVGVCVYWCVCVCWCVCYRVNTIVFIIYIYILLPKIFRMLRKIFSITKALCYYQRFSFGKSLLLLYTWYTLCIHCKYTMLATYYIKCSHLYLFCSFRIISLYIIES